MFHEIKKNLFFKRCNLLFQEGLNNKEILPFEDELFERLNSVYLNGVPITFYLKYIRPIPEIQPGQCYDRSLFITMGMDDAILVRGDSMDLYYKYGEECAGHGWVEKDDWVYDTSLMMKIKKERYYNMYLPYNISYYDSQQYQNNSWYQDIVNTTIDDLKSDGSKRYFLSIFIPPIEDIAEKSNNLEFKELLRKHLELINYDYDKIADSLHNAVIGLNKVK